MEHDKTAGQGLPNDHSTYNEAENMDRAAQSGTEGAFGEDNTNSDLADLRRDAEAAFGTEAAGASE
ncbi:MAG: hypothetical protein AVDCRST_MAG26-1856 [uncultured Chloroflexia bacterium]|uniref:Uncharacterized protein n=1 Tax=uncultured Chloroflexia bacterium TaxID=1672391 RepID=A0A6J4IGU6_9CHLR|nr:MAG: hypothetical protein AVDCRST_MAG26-1856 [uncultured Chloroflexia bacterium]